MFDPARRFKTRQQDFSTAKAKASLTLTDWKADASARSGLQTIDVAVVVFSLSDSATLDHARHCIRRLRDPRQSKLSPTAPIWLVANKVDLLGSAPPDKLARIAKVRSEAKALAKEQRLPYAETSARTGEGVSTLFRDIARLVRRSV